jgi:hypothetical protein
MSITIIVHDSGLDDEMEIYRNWARNYFNHPTCLVGDEMLNFPLQTQFGMIDIAGLASLTDEQLAAIFRR